MTKTRKKIGGVFPKLNLLFALELSIIVMPNEKNYMLRIALIAGKMTRVGLIKSPVRLIFASLLSLESSL